MSAKIVIAVLMFPPADCAPATARVSPFPLLVHPRKAQSIAFGNLSSAERRVIVGSLAFHQSLSSRCPDFKFRRKHERQSDLLVEDRLIASQTSIFPLYGDDVVFQDAPY